MKGRGKQVIFVTTLNDYFYFSFCKKGSTFRWGILSHSSHYKSYMVKHNQFVSSFAFQILFNHILFLIYLVALLNV